jgi:hypothetical protein
MRPLRRAREGPGMITAFDATATEAISEAILTYLLGIGIGIFIGWLRWGRRR